MTNLNRRMQQ